MYYGTYNGTDLFIIYNLEFIIYFVNNYIFFFAGEC